MIRRAGEDGEVARIGLPVEPISERRDIARSELAAAEEGIGGDYERGEHRDEREGREDEREKSLHVGTARQPAKKWERSRTKTMRG
jgi:hypothetical protein